MAEDFDLGSRIGGLAGNRSGERVKLGCLLRIPNLLVLVGKAGDEGLVATSRSYKN
ncbi:MAG: hypothetical protein ACREEM_18820 [Blastocatellia bacterium]